MHCLQMFYEFAVTRYFLTNVDNWVAFLEIGVRAITCTAIPYRESTGFLYTGRFL